jgi:hypothetical protein
MTEFIRRWRAAGVICIAVAVAGPVQAQGPAPVRARVVSEDETLRGHTAMSVQAVVEGTREMTAAALKSHMARRLRENGITVRETGYPQLTLTLSTLITGSPTQYIVFSLRLELVQTLPLPASGAAGALGEASTWQRGTFGIFEVFNVDRIQTSAENLIGVFLGSFLTVNPGVVKTVNNGRARVMGLGRGVLGNFPRDRADEAAVQKQIDALTAKNQQVISCAYGEPGQIYEYTFWYRTAPEGIAQILKSLRGEDHPFWTLGVKAIETCPPTRDMARTALQNSRYP